MAVYDSTPLQSRTSRRWMVLVVAALAAALAGVGYWQWMSKPAVQEFSHQDEPDPDPVATNPGYVGVQACASCHRERVAEFEQTTHFRACREPRAGEMPPGFAPGKGEYHSRIPALRFQTGESGGKFTQSAILSTPAGEQRSDAPIDLLYGNGVGDQIYFAFRDDRLFELPVAWLFPLNRWAEKPFDPHASGNYLKSTNPRCLECHNTWIGHVAGSENQYRRDNMILGVTCETCHGPGGEHVAYHQSHPDAKSSRTIIHPGRLSRERQMDVCGQCHSNAPKRRGPPFSYRPGEPLDAFFRSAANMNQENDHVADQVKYLMQSTCFQKSDTLTCVTCHNPHRPPTSGVQESGAMQRSCQKCHQPANCHERPRLPAAVRDQCVDCHMPQFSRIQVLFHTPQDQYLPQIRPRQHRIGVHPTATREVLLNWHRSQTDAASRQEAARLSQALVQRWLKESETLRKEYRFIASIAALREALRIEPTPATRAQLDDVIAIQAKLDTDWYDALHSLSERRPSEAAERFERMLTIKPDHAQAHYRFGRIYAEREQMDQARSHLRAAAKYDPDDESGNLMLGWLAYLSGKPEEAIEYYRRADAITPYNSKVNHLWGIALASLKRWPESLERFRLVLKIDPNHEGGCVGLAKALRQQGHPQDAVRYAQKAARLTRFENIDALLTLADIYLDLNRREEAEDVVRRASEAATRSDANLTGDLSWRLVQIRGRLSRPAN